MTRDYYSIVLKTAAWVCVVSLVAFGGYSCSQHTKAKREAAKRAWATECVVAGFTANQCGFLYKQFKRAEEDASSDAGVSFINGMTIGGMMR